MNSSQKLAVHFGAGNIGRGLIGAALQQAGYFVIFADINDELVAQLNNAKRYTLTELGESGKSLVFDNFLAYHTVQDHKQLVSALADADIVTASVGVATLARIAPIIQEGLLQRRKAERAVVMACENAINASDILFNAMSDKERVSQKAVFCNTAVDRIVPLQNSANPIDVSVEAFSEWVIDVSRIESKLDLPGTLQVSNLAPYIERKLFTVNTAHLAAAYFGQQSGHDTIVLSLEDADVLDRTSAVLHETSSVLRAKHFLDQEEQRKYVSNTLTRLRNPAIDDFVTRVGREPLRKLSRTERVIGPAAYFAESIGTPKGLLLLVDAALCFRSAEDSQVQQLGQMLLDQQPEDLAKQICGIDTEHPLAEELIGIFDLHKSAVSRKH